MSLMELLVLEMKLLGVALIMKPADLSVGDFRSINILPSGTFWTLPDHNFTFSSRTESIFGEP